MKFPSTTISPAALAALVLACPSPLARAADTVLLDAGAPATALIPTAGNEGNTLALADWTKVADPPNQANWIPGTTAVGYDENNEYNLNLDLDAVMNGQSTTAYIRLPFSVDPATLDALQSLRLEMKFDDGFIAYLNGREVESVNPPLTAPNFQSGAGENHEAGALFESFDITAFAGLLRPGDNMLAIHGLNDGLVSSDFLILPRLVADDTPPPVMPDWPDLQLGSPVITGATSPVDIVHAGDGTGRLFIAERAGRVRIWNGSTLQLFLDISSRVRTTDNGGDERGLLGIAFPPGYAQTQHFYVCYISSVAGRSGDSVIARIAVNPIDANDALENSETDILVIDQPQQNHNGGQIHFGMDGFLYIGMGDGGGGGDNDSGHGTIGNGQEPGTLLGKMLRIDVEGTPDPGLPYAIPPDNPFVNTFGVPDEIWAFGLRNPWRWSFDRKTGDLYIGDVGQGTREEISFAPASSPGGENYQWRQLEGFFTHNGSTPLTNGVSTNPIFDYPRGLGTSITGGYVYRGGAYPRMQGVFFFGDYNSGRIWGLQRDEVGTWHDTEFVDTALRISCFGEDEAGNLYVASLFTGDIHELTDTRARGYMLVSDLRYDEQGRFQITFGSEIGARYQMQVSLDLTSWVDLGAAQDATAFTTTMSGTLPEPLPVKAFVRAVELE